MLLEHGPKAGLLWTTTVGAFNVRVAGAGAVIYGEQWSIPGALAITAGGGEPFKGSEGGDARKWKAELSSLEKRKPMAGSGRRYSVNHPGGGQHKSTSFPGEYSKGTTR